jgi:hypothetical protein
MNLITLQEVIQQHVHLDRPNALGWRPVLCKVCGDKGRKGKRAGFKFDGEVCAYNCFNCATAAVFNPVEHRTMPPNMLAVLRAFDIPDSDWQPVLYTALVNADGRTGTAEAVSAVSIEPEEIHALPFFIPLTDDKNNEWCQYAIEYLRDERGIDWKTYPFMVAKKVNHPDNERWYGRLIIPFYKDKKLIFYQGRDLTDLHVKKYLNPSVPRDNILSGYEKLFAKTSDPLYVTEGWFDAYHVQGVAVFGNKMTANQIKWLNQSHRPKVVIPDRFGDGYLLAEQALELGWSISTPDIGSMKDVNAAVMKYGQLYTRKTIREQTCTGVAALMNLGVYCEHKKKEKKNGKRKASTS